MFIKKTLTEYCMFLLKSKLLPEPKKKKRHKQMSYVHSFWLGCYFLHTFVDYVRCSDHPCLNSISCTDLIGDYSCLCQQGFTDKNCSTSEFFNVFPLSGSCFSIRLFTESKTWKKRKFLRVSLWLCYTFYNCEFI